MPISKVPVVHKFGIISSSQRLELQERLLKQTYLSSIKSKRATYTQRNPLEVTEEFVQQFNSAKDFDEKETFEEKARKLLERSKRRCGVKHCGHGDHVNLPLAWTEMAQLAQCKGRIQEDCLDTLVTSLDVSPVEKYHIPALFFLAETMLYWLRTEAVLQPFLRTGEIKLLKMGQLVFQRLFYHHMAGQLQGHIEAKNRLFTYIDGLQECQEAYNPYPNALLSLRFIIEVGKIILADSQLEPGDIKEGDRLPDAPKHNMEELSSVTREMFEKRNQDDTRSIHSAAISSSVHDLSPTLWHALDVWRCTNSLSGGLREALKALAHCGLGLASETWIDGMIAIQILGETAKTNMSAMRVLHRLAQGVKTTEDLMTPPLSSRSERSDMFSISSDGNALLEEDEERKLEESRASFYSSKPSLSDIYERSEEGDGEKKIKSEGNGSTTTEDAKSDQEDEERKLEESRASFYSSKPSLSDIYERSEEGDGEKKIKSEGNGSTTTEDAKSDQTHTEESEISLSRKEDTNEAMGQDDTLLKGGEGNLEGIPKTALRESGGPSKSSITREVSFDEATLMRSSGTEFSKSAQGKISQGSDFNQLSAQGSKLSFRSMDRGTGWKVEVGSDFKSGRASDASSVPTFTNHPLVETPGITGWHWEVAITYTDILANVVLFGNTANIQKHALIGSNIDGDNIHRRGYNSNISIGTSQLSSAGLLDLAFFKPRNESSDGGPNDWSWRIRYGAIRSLVRLCRCLDGDTNREGLRSTAWNVLLRAHAMEKDARVLEALKVGQVHTDGNVQLDQAFQTNPAILGKRIAQGLSAIYLPPLPPPVTASPPKIPVRTRLLLPPHVQKKSKIRQPLRTTLKQEIELATALYQQAPNYNTRTSFDLRRVVEDQWRKEMQAALEAEEEAELKRIKEIQIDREKRERETKELKEQKFIKKIFKDDILKLGLPRKETPLGSFS